MQFLLSRARRVGILQLQRAREIENLEVSDDATAVLVDFCFRTGNCLSRQGITQKPGHDYDPHGLRGADIWNTYLPRG